MERKRILIYFLLFLTVIASVYAKGAFGENIANKGLSVSKEEKIHIVVDIDSNILYVYDINNQTIINQYPVATGKWKTPTPTGTYTITEKAVWGGGFGSKWMKLSVPWGQYGIHGTDKPHSIGYSASSGCVRMNNEDIDELYKIVDYGTKVTLFKGPFGPFGYGFRTLKPGDRGEDVMAVQKKLKELGYYSGSIDGVYGNGMKKALYSFLKDNDMKITDWITTSVYKKLEFNLFE